MIFGKTIFFNTKHKCTYLLYISNDKRVFYLYNVDYNKTSLAGNVKTVNISIEDFVMST